MVLSQPRDTPETRQVREVLGRVIRERSVVTRSDGSIHSVFPVAIGENEGASLREWVRRERAERTIEIGLGYGISALFICEGLLMNGGRSPRHVVIDPHQERRFSNCGLQVLDEAGLAPLVEHHASESQTLLPKLLDEERAFDLAMVDGNHRFDAVFVDLVYLGRLLRPGSVVFLDDYQLPGVAKAAAFFLTNVNWTLEEVSPDDPVHQWAVLRTSCTADARPFDYFADF